MVVVVAEAKPQKEKLKCQRKRDVREVVVRALQMAKEKALRMANGGGEGTANGEGGGEGTAREEEEEEKAMAKGKSGTQSTRGGKSGSLKKWGYKRGC